MPEGVPTAVVDFSHVDCFIVYTLKIVFLLKLNKKNKIQKQNHRIYNKMYFIWYF